MVSTRWDLATRSQLSCEGLFFRREVEVLVTLFCFPFLVSRVIPKVVRTCHIFIGSRLRAVGCDQHQSFWHLGVMFTVL